MGSSGFMGLTRYISARDEAGLEARKREANLVASGKFSPKLARYWPNSKGVRCSFGWGLREERSRVTEQDGVERGLEGGETQTVRAST